MILKAIERGVSEDRLAAILNVNPDNIRRKPTPARRNLRRRCLPPQGYLVLHRFLEPPIVRQEFFVTCRRRNGFAERPALCISWLEVRNRTQLMVVSPFGFWTSPITSDLVVADAVRLDQIALDGNAIYWTETQPQKQGRYFV